MILNVVLGLVCLLLLILFLSAAVAAAWFYLQGDPKVESFRADMRNWKATFDDRGLEVLSELAESWTTYDESALLDTVARLYRRFQNDARYRDEILRPALRSGGLAALVGDEESRDWLKRELAGLGYSLTRKSSRAA